MICLKSALTDTETLPLGDKTSPCESRDVAHELWGRHSHFYAPALEPALSPTHDTYTTETELTPSHVLTTL